MVTRSLFTGVSGLQSHLDKMDVISDNLSNVNTPGFKKSTVVFKSFLSQKIASASAPTQQRGGTNPQQIGLGVQTGSINLDMGQGQLQRTGVSTDLAVQGSGFFQVRESGSSNNLYTRAGSFQFDAEGRLVDPGSGNVVQGLNSTVEDGRIVFNPQTATVDDIQIGPDKEVIPGSATTEQTLAGNLDASANVGIEPINVDFEDSQVRFEFERYHPTQKLYRFTAVWTENPPSGKQIGDAVEDRITGRNLEGIMRLNDDGQVTGIFENPDRSGNIGAARIEVDRNNAGDYTLDEERLTIRDQSNFLEDLQPNVTDQFRLQITNDAASPPEFTVQWQDVEGNWNNFNGFQNQLDPPNPGEVGEDFVMQRTTSGGNERIGEIRIDGEFWGNPSNVSNDDVIYFQAHQGEGNNVLNQNGEEVKREFLWGGTSGPSQGRYRVSEPEADPNNAAGSGSLSSVFNYDEGGLSNISSTSSLNNIENKEFRITFPPPGTGPIPAGTPSGTQFTVSSPGAGVPNIVNQNGNRNMSINDDNQLYLDTGEELGISIAAENWSGSFADDDEFTFTVTESRSVDSGRPFTIVQDGDGNDTALFAPSGTSTQPSSINFSPNLNDSSGILNNPSFTDLQASSGTAAEADARSDEEIQKATSSDVFDSQGAQHSLTYRFEKKDTNEWLWHALDPAPVDSNNPRMAGFGRLTFNESGGLQNAEVFDSKVAGDLPPPGPQGDLERGRVYFNPPQNTLQSDPSDSDNLNPDQGAEPVSILPDFGTVTQFAGASDAEVRDQDGSSRGRLQSLSFDSTGTLSGAYDNGQSRDLAQVVLASFRNPEGLEKQGGTYFAESANSGIAREGQPGSGGRGTITPGALERSNVDLSAQFTKLISTQRGFQANTRTIRTSDQLIQEVLQLV